MKKLIRILVTVVFIAGQVMPAPNVLFASGTTAPISPNDAGDLTPTKPFDPNAPIPEPPTAGPSSNNNLDPNPLTPASKDIDDITSLTKEEMRKAVENSHGFGDGSVEAFFYAPVRRVANDIVYDGVRVQYTLRISGQQTQFRQATLIFLDGEHVTTADYEKLDEPISVIQEAAPIFEEMFVTAESAARVVADTNTAQPLSDDIDDVVEALRDREIDHISRDDVASLFINDTFGFFLVSNDSDGRVAVAYVSRSPGCPCSRILFKTSAENDGVFLEPAELVGDIYMGFATDGQLAHLPRHGSPRVIDAGGETTAIFRRLRVLPPIPLGWTRAESNPNFAYRSEAPSFNTNFVVLELLDLNSGQTYSLGSTEVANRYEDVDVAADGLNANFNIVDGSGNIVVSRYFDITEQTLWAFAKSNPKFVFRGWTVSKASHLLLRHLETNETQVVASASVERYGDKVFRVNDVSPDSVYVAFDNGSGAQIQIIDYPNTKLELEIEYGLARIEWTALTSGVEAVILHGFNPDNRYIANLRTLTAGKRFVSRYKNITYYGRDDQNRLAPHVVTPSDYLFNEDLNKRLITKTTRVVYAPERNVNDRFVKLSTRTDRYVHVTKQIRLVIRTQTGKKKQWIVSGHKLDSIERLADGKTPLLTFTHRQTDEELQIVYDPKTKTGTISETEGLNGALDTTATCSQPDYAVGSARASRTCMGTVQTPQGLREIYFNGHRYGGNAVIQVYDPKMQTGTRYHVGERLTPSQVSTDGRWLVVKDVTTNVGLVHPNQIYVIELNDNRLAALAVTPTPASLDLPSNLHMSSAQFVSENRALITARSVNAGSSGNASLF